MTQRNDDPLTGPGTTSDPNQADRTGLPGRKKFTKVPDEPKGPPQRNDHPGQRPGHDGRSQHVDQCRSGLIRRGLSEQPLALFVDDLFGLEQREPLGLIP